MNRFFIFIHFLYFIVTEALRLVLPRVCFPLFPVTLQLVPIRLLITTTAVSSAFELLLSRSPTAFVWPALLDMPVFFSYPSLLSEAFDTVGHFFVKTLHPPDSVIHTLCNFYSVVSACAISLEQVDVGLPWSPFSFFPFPGGLISPFDSSRT